MMIRVLLSLILLLASASSFAVNVVFSDDFERTLLGTDWIVTPIGSRGKAAIGTHISNSGSRSMYTCCDEVYVTSRAMDLSGVNYAEVSIWIASGSDDYSEWASSGDDLEVQAYLNDGTWQVLEIFEGGGDLHGDIYNFVAKLPDKAYHSGFRLRFHQLDGSGTKLSDRDFWHIDDVTVTDYQVGPTQYPLFFDDFERSTLLTTGDWSINRIDGNFNSDISTHFSTSGSRSMYTCCGRMYTTTRDIDLSGYTFAEISFEVMQGDDSVSGSSAAFGSFDSETPSLGDDVQVQIYMNDGSWREIDYYYGSTLTDGERHTYHARVPDGGYHSAFKLRFHQVKGTHSSIKHYDLWHIDEVFVGTRSPAGPDHFRLSYASNALTCSPQDVTVTACANAACTSQYTGSVTVDLSPTGWVGGDSLTFSGGTGAAQLSHTTAGTVTLDVPSSVPAKSGGGVRCSIDGGPYTGSCDLTFATSGFTYAIPDIIAAKGTTGVTVKAVKEGDTQQCVPAFSNVSKTLDLWTDYASPLTGSRAISVNTVDVGLSEGGATQQTLNFDANGETTIDVNYTDAGEVHLKMKYTGSGSDSGLEMKGSGTFVSRPAGLCVAAATTCPAGDSSCGAFAVAGDAFSLLVTPKAWVMDLDPDFCDNPVATPNYTASNLAISHSLVSPSPGNAGTVSPGSYNHAVSGTGTNSINTSLSEVGVFTFTVTPPSYFTHSLGSFTSAPIGRFYPDHFDAVWTDPGEIAPSCNGSVNDFLYTGEAGYWLSEPTLTLTAKNSSGGTTQNYTRTGYMRLSGSGVTVNAPTTDNSATGTDGNPLAVSVTPQTGSLSVSGSGQVQYVMNLLDQIRYTRNTLSEVAPFSPDLTWSLTAVTDSDGVSLNPVMAPLTSSPVAGFEVRFGRLWLENSYGPETEDLYLPLRTEYFSGSRYVLNTDDICSSWDSVNAGVTPASLTATGVSAGVLVDGRSDSNGILLQAPTTVAGTPDTGEATVTYSADSWLQGDYDNDGSFENPQGIATFGIFRGHQRLIFRKEKH